MNRWVVIGIAVATGAAVSVVGLGVVHASAAGGGGAGVLDHAAASAGRALLLYLVMVGGVLANYLYTSASASYSGGQPFGGVGPLLASARTSPRLWMALAVSPFLFHGIHVVAATVPDDATSFFFAFQNGFFWQAVFAGFQEKAGAQEEAEPAPAAVS